MTPALVRSLGKPLADLTGVTISAELQADAADAVEVDGKQLS